MKSQRLFAAIWVLVMIVPFCQAGSFSGWVLAGSNVSLDNQQFFVSIGPDWKIVQIDSGDSIYLVEKGSCESNLDYKICFSDSRWNFTEKQGKYDPVSGIKTPELLISVDSLAPIVRVERSADKTSPVVNEVVIVSIRVVVEGGSVTNLHYTENLPSVAEILDAGSAKANGNVINWEYPALTGESTFSYKVRLIRYANITLGGEFSYYWNKRQLNLSVPRLELKTFIPANPLQSSVSLSTESPKPGEKVEYKLRLVNGDKNPIGVDPLKIAIDSRASIISFTPGLSRNGNTFLWNGSVDSEGTREIVIMMEFDNTGKYKVYTYVKNRYLSEKENKYYFGEAEVDKQISVSIGQPIASFKISPSKKLSAGEEGEIILYVENNQNNPVFFEPAGLIKSGLFSVANNSINSLAPGQKKELARASFVAPSLESEKSYEIVGEMKYKTAYNEYFSVNVTDSIVVMKDPYYITPSNNSIKNVSNKSEGNESGNISDVNKGETAGQAGSPVQGTTIPSQGADIKKSGFFGRLIEGVSLFFKKLFG